MSSEIVITPRKAWWKLDLGEIWQFRELFYVFSWRDVKIRYKQTVLGVLWVFLQPLVTTGIFSVIFGKIAHIPSDKLPYPLFIFIGVTIWNFFATGLSNAANSLIANSGIISKVYFPRLIVPIATVLTAGVDFLVTLPLLIAAIIYFGFIPNPIGIIVIPLALLILILTACGLGFFSAALNLKYRDVRYVLPFAIQTMFYGTPIIYPRSVLFDYRRIILSFNPMTGVVESIRAVISNSAIDWGLISLDLVIAVLLFIVGLWYFRQTEAFFVDIV